MMVPGVTRPQLRKLFLRHRGESARLARDLQLSPVSIAAWFRGRSNSSRIEAAALIRAKELLQKDAQEEAAKARIQRELAKVQAAAQPLAS
jgi:hypothetical protein